MKNYTTMQLFNTEKFKQKVLFLSGSRPFLCFLCLPPPQIPLSAFFLSRQFHISEEQT